MFDQLACHPAASRARDAKARDARPQESIHRLGFIFTAS